MRTCFEKRTAHDGARPKKNELLKEKLEFEFEFFLCVHRIDAGREGDESYYEQGGRYVVGIGDESG